MNIDKYRQEDGTYLDEEGITHENAVDFLCSKLNFCGCGQPEEGLYYVLKSLRYIDLLKDVWNKKMSNELYCNKSPFNSEGEEMFVRYILDHLGFTTHGGGVGGAWLEDKGKELLSDLEELFKKRK
jgi:hypothetical protein